MPWLSIIMAIISALASLKSKPGDKGRAVAAAALGGLGTYYVTHETEWGKDVLGGLDGVAPPTPNPGPGTVTLPDGSSTQKDGTSVPNPNVGAPNAGKTTGVWDVLTSWGPTGTAAVIGTGVVAADSNLRKWLPIAALALGAFLLLK